jgi:hypothetical protein
VVQVNAKDNYLIVNLAWDFSWLTASGFGQFVREWDFCYQRSVLENGCVQSKSRAEMSGIRIPVRSEDTWKLKAAVIIH